MQIIDTGEPRTVSELLTLAHPITGFIYHDNPGRNHRLDRAVIGAKAMNYIRLWGTRKIDDGRIQDATRIDVYMITPEGEESLRSRKRKKRYGPESL
jgi:hypothetical protein